LDCVIKNNLNATHPLSTSLKSNDCTTDSGVFHRELTDLDHIDTFLGYMLPILQKHHVSKENLGKRIKQIKIMGYNNIKSPISPDPKRIRTQRANFAEIFLAEYLQLTTDVQLPVYRLRYNPNVEESMKGDDVLLFDLDSTPVRIIVGEAKFRGTPTKEAVTETIDTLIRSYNNGLPISLMFIADRLIYDEKNEELGNKVFNCSLLFAHDKLKIEYVGFLMSGKNTNKHINQHTTNELHNLLMISLGMNSPVSIVEQAFKTLEAEL
jgi:hypothetical protein